ncbi:MAG: hypothetical protein ACPGWR_07420, partial [Ardenticatenaceae bacterium]
MLTSHQIDELEIIWIETPHYAGTQVLNTSPKTRVIRDFFSRRHWWDGGMVGWWDGGMVGWWDGG